MPAYSRKPITQILYFVEVNYGTKIGRAFVELDRDRNSREAVIEDIRTGQHRDVLTILEVDASAGRCRDVTLEILGEAQFAAELAEINRQADAFDHARDLLKHEVVR